jgi:hypothetical protein
MMAMETSEYAGLITSLGRINGLGRLHSPQPEELPPFIINAFDAKVDAVVADQRVGSLCILAMRDG